MDSKDFLEVGKDLRKRAATADYDEACHRSSISRSYYSAYNFADERCRTREKHRPAFSTHSELIGYYVNHIDRPRRKIGNRLNNLKDYREESDYLYYRGTPQIRDFPTTSGQSLKLASKIIELIENL